MSTLKKPEPTEVSIAQIKPITISVSIEGKSPLLVCRFSAKMKQQLLDASTGKGRAKRVARDPKQEFFESRYISTEDWDGVPASGIKGCLVNACRAIEGIPMTHAKRFLFVKGQGVSGEGQELVKIHGKCEMDRRTVRLKNGDPMERFRAIYREWSMEFELEFVVFSIDQVVSLTEWAGYCEGLCEHRPGSPESNTGVLGRFGVKRGGESTKKAS